MSTFRFKRFDVVNERSAMKVKTDGVLLGAVMTILPSDRRILDIGTGTGTVALMAAQRLMDMVCGVFVDAHIDAIDIDEPSVAEAAENFRNSPWGSVLYAHHASLDDFSADLQSDMLTEVYGAGTFDLIFSNPPYFDNALQAPARRRNAARHTTTGLSYREVLDFAAQHLTPNGRVAMVLPADTEHDLTRHARMNGLHLNKITRIRTVPRKAPARMITEFSRHRCETVSEELLTIQKEGQYTEEYLSLTHDFYLFA